jgi:integrase
MNRIQQPPETESHRPFRSRAEQVHKLLDEFRRFGDSWLVGATLLTAECGMQLQEIVTLEWRGVDLVAGTIEVPGPQGIRQVRMSERVHGALTDVPHTAGNHDAYVFFPLTDRNDARQRIGKSFSRTCERLELTPFPFQAIRNSLARARQPRTYTSATRNQLRP